VAVRLWGPVGQGKVVWWRGEVGGEGGGAVGEEEGGVDAFEVLQLCGDGEGGADDGGAGGWVVGCDVAVWVWEGVWDRGHRVFSLLFDVRLRSRLEWGGKWMRSWERKAGSGWTTLCRSYALD
jgi:hypothetical protein